jgi:hypothetical protein
VTTGATSGSIALNVDNFDITRYNNITGNIVLAAPGGTPVDGKAIMYMFYATASFLIDCTNAAFIGSNTLTLPTSMPAMTNSVVWKIQFRYSALSGKYELEFFG